MNLNELEKAYPEAFKNYEMSGFRDLSDEDLKVLVVYETLTDGADLDVAMDVADNTDREGRIRMLIRSFGYSTDEEVFADE